MCDNKILDLVKTVVTNENFNEYELEIHGKSGPGDGYMGRIIFITVNGKTNTNKTKTLNLAIKLSTENTIFRNQIPVQRIFEQEIYIYDKVIPTFKNFQQEIGFRSEVLEVLPKCYASQRSENEILILENLKTKGFDVWDRKVPMTINYITKILDAYAEWHAFSLALKWKRPEIFKELVKDYTNMWSCHIKQAEIDPVFFQYHEEVRKFWENDEKEVGSLKFSQAEVSYIFHKLIYEDPEHHVILHSDSWTNNFMFKENSKNSLEACIIDWQFSSLSSPIIDLSYFIYTCVNNEEFADVRELLKIYHDRLSKTLYQFGCDPLKVLPFNRLVQQWKKFSCWGVLMGTFILKFSLCESDDAPDFVEGAKNGKKFAESCDFNITNREVYYQRVKDNILHYIKNLNA